MGQGAIERGKYKKEIFLKKPEELISKLGLNSENYFFMPSMYPDINIKCNNQKSLNELLIQINNLVDSKFNPFLKLRYEVNSNTLNLIINNQIKLIEDNYLFLKNNKFSIEELGLEFFERDIGTGYHIPEGILLSFGSKSSNILKNFKKIDTTLIAPIILKFFNLKSRKYMHSI